MWSLFHHSPSRASQVLIRKLESHNFLVNTSSRDLPKRTILDTPLWHLLSHDLVMIRTESEEPGVALHEIGGSLRCQDREPEPILEEHLAGIIHDWKLKPQLVISSIGHTIQTLGVRIEMEECLIQAGKRDALKGALITIHCETEQEDLVRQLVKHLSGHGGIATTWPLATLVAKAAAQDGWTDAETASLRRNEWADLLRPLVATLEELRDQGETAAVHEVRVMLRHVQVLLEIARQLNGKPAKPAKETMLKELEHDLDVLRQLDVLIDLLETGQASKPTTWVGIPGIMDTAAGLDGQRLVDLIHGLQTWRAGEHSRLVQNNRYLRRPVLLHDLSIRWPANPIFSRHTKDQRSQMAEMLEGAIRKLIKEIKSLPPEPDLETWQELRRRCRRIYEILDTFPSLKKNTEVRFLRHMIRLWLRRLGELQDVLAAMALLADPAAPADGHILVESMQAWVDSVKLQIEATLPALHMAARNARKTLV